MTLLEQMVGKKYGSLTVLEIGTAPALKRIRKVKCLCDCGEATYAESTQVRSGRTTTCGGHIHKAAIASARFTKHGCHGTPEYRAWQAMRTRCNNPNIAQAKDYSGKGVACCPEWAKFEVFLADVGKKPTPKHTLDRKENHLGYNKDNCRWATQLTQVRNRDFNVKPEYLGEKYNSLTELAQMLGFPYYTLRSRLRYGWSIKDAVETPIRRLSKQGEKSERRHL